MSWMQSSAASATSRTCWRATSSMRTSGEVLGRGRPAASRRRSSRSCARPTCTKVQVFAPSGRVESALIKNTLGQGPDALRGGGAQADLLAAASGRRAEQGDGARRRWTASSSRPKRYDLGRVGRYKINQRLGLNRPANETVLTREDFVAIIRYLVELHEGRGHTDDIDHLGNRRIRSVGELIANQFSVGLSRMARLVKERMSINTDPEKISLDDLVNARTVSRRDPGVLRIVAAVAVHGPDESARRADAQAAAVGARTGRADARARRLRSPRRALLAVRPDVPDRDAGRSEHRPHHVARLLRAGERPRVHRDAVPRRQERAR